MICGLLPAILAYDFKYRQTLLIKLLKRTWVKGWERIAVSAHLIFGRYDFPPSQRTSVEIWTAVHGAIQSECLLLKVYNISEIFLSNFLCINSFNFSLQFYEIHAITILRLWRKNLGLKEVKPPAKCYRDWSATQWIQDLAPSSLASSYPWHYSHLMLL